MLREVKRMNSKIYRAFRDPEGEQKIRDRKVPNHRECPFYFEVLVHNAVEFVLPDDVLFAGCEHPEFGKQYAYACYGQCVDGGKPYGREMKTLHGYMAKNINTGNKMIL